jgi:hypothetical protein
MCFLQSNTLHDVSVERALEAEGCVLEAEGCVLELEDRGKSKAEAGRKFLVKHFRLFFEFTTPNFRQNGDASYHAICQQARKGQIDAEYTRLRALPHWRQLPENAGAEETPMATATAADLMEEDEPDGGEADMEDF